MRIKKSLHSFISQHILSCSVTKRTLESSSFCVIHELQMQTFEMNPSSNIHWVRAVKLSCGGKLSEGATRPESFKGVRTGSMNWWKLENILLNEVFNWKEMHGKENALRFIELSNF